MAITKLSFLAFLLISLCFFTSLSSSLRTDILLCISLLSSSIFFSPGPLVPIPPPSLEREDLSPTSLTAAYFNCASSTCILPSPVLALFANISSINMVLSTTLVSSILSKFLSCAGLSSSSQSTPSASMYKSISFNSSSLPFPR